MVSSSRRDLSRPGWAWPAWATVPILAAVTAAVTLGGSAATAPPRAIAQTSDVTPPVTTASVLPVAYPNGPPGDVYPDSVEVELSATDGETEEASGVARTDYRVDGGDWETAENTGAADPFRTYVQIEDEGEHEVEFRSVDNAGNIEETKSIAFEIDPGADECDVYAEGGAWVPDHCSIRFGGKVRWHLGAQAHDLWLIEPVSEPDAGFPLTDGPISGGEPIEYQFFQAGTWTFVCKLHSFVNEGAWEGMVGTVSVAPRRPDTTPPETTIVLNGLPPQTSYDGPVTATFTAVDPGSDPSEPVVTEYRIDSDSENDWEEYDASAPPIITEPGPHTIDYRSTDNGWNTEETKTVAFEITDGGGGPELRLRPQPRVVTVGKRTQQAKLRFRATNVGDRPSGPVSLCVKAPKKRLAIKGRKCVSRPSIDPGQTRLRPVRLRVKPQARGKPTRVTLIARGPGFENQKVFARVRAKR